MLFARIVLLCLITGLSFCQRKTLKGLLIGKKFDYTLEYADWQHVYSKYLTGPREDVEIGGEQLEKAYQYAEEKIKEYHKRLKIYLNEFPHYERFDKELLKLMIGARFNELATEYLVKELNLNKHTISQELSKFKCKLRHHHDKQQFHCSTAKKTCANVKCDANEKYWRPNGTCNNLVHNQLGAGRRCHRRLLPADYADGISAPRVAADGEELPDARVVANILEPPHQTNSAKFSHMSMEWQQLLAHDHTKTVVVLGTTFDCCHPTKWDECMVIDRFTPDNWTRLQENDHCLSFRRSVACNSCQLGPREQFNLVSSILDLSNVYGSDQKSSDSLRTFYGGQLRTSHDRNNEPILPKRHEPQELDPYDLFPCREKVAGLSCFHSGDGHRVNQQQMIAALQTIIIRRHNQIASRLSVINPLWDDQRLYQETRRIVVAEVQAITYKELVPMLLAPKLISYFDLSLSSSGFTEYNPDVDPSSIQELVASVFRRSHAMVRDKYSVVDGAKIVYRFLGHHFFDMTDLWKGHTDGIIEGFLFDATAKGLQLPLSLRQFTFSQLDESTGHLKMINDLAAIDIQRGRDHGLPSYVHYLEYCYGFEITSWDDLDDFLGKENVDKMKTVYKSHLDVDLVIGVRAEIHNRLVFNCLHGIHFYHLKFGDRFYFEHGNQPNSFTSAQLDNLRKFSTLSNLICQTTSIKEVPRNAFYLHSPTNPMVSCFNVTDINLKLWADVIV